MQLTANKSFPSFPINKKKSPINSTTNRFAPRQIIACLKNTGSFSVMRNSTRKGRVEGSIIYISTLNNIPNKTHSIFVFWLWHCNPNRTKLEIILFRAICFANKSHINGHFLIGHSGDDFFSLGIRKELSVYRKLVKPNWYFRSHINAIKTS